MNDTVDFDSLPIRVQRDLEDAFEQYPRQYHDPDKPMLTWEALDGFLRWNGIIGWTDYVVGIVNARTVKP